MRLTLRTDTPSPEPVFGTAGGRLRLVWAVLLTLFFATMVVRAAWLNDDAYITFRVVDNLFHGYGLTWNVSERVQVFTHPLWLALLVVGQAVTGELYLSTLALSIGLSTVVFWGVVGSRERDTAVSLLAGLLLTLSTAYIDYATSGLENPLTHLLVLLFAWYYWREAAVSRRRLFLLTLLLSLAMLTRTDLLFLLGPMLALVWWQERAWRQWPLVLLGLLPLIAWELFSLVYYGFPFPNTAYAKAFDTGIPRAALLASGWHYVRNSWLWDPLTLATTGAALLRAVTTRQRQALAAAGGIGLYLAYVVQIGGDFMSGRFLTAPFLLAVLLLRQYPPAWLRLRWTAVLLAAAIVVVGMLAAFPPLWNTAVFGTLPQHLETWRDGDIANERVFYYPHTGLLVRQPPPHPWAEQARASRAEGQLVVQRGNVGFFGYFAGPGIHVVDHYGVTDPLLARLPAENPAEWRIGHIRRPVPAGYLETIGSGQNVLADPNLAAYYDQLRLVIRGDIWSWPRFQAIWRLNSGHYNHLLPAPAAPAN